MTPDEIDQLTPGPAMDASVAEHVMGWRWLNLAGKERKLYRRQFVAPERVADWFALDQWDELPEPHPDSVVDGSGCPPYSTDTASAMELLGQVVNLIPGTATFALHCVMPGSGDSWAWECRIEELFGGLYVGGSGDTAPEAICKAAMKVAPAPGSEVA